MGSAVRKCGPMYSALKRVVLGSPIATSEEHQTRLPKKVALPVFASDAISSTAYATQEILIVLIPAVGLAATDYLVPLAVVVCILLAIVITSYRQTIMAYPGGGGTYIVSRENLGPQVALVAGASILVDYVLTVAVSVSAGVAAITSAFPELSRYRVGMCLGFIALMTVANLRGMKESGTIFAPPTYIYVTILFAMIVLGLYRYYSGDLARLPADQEAIDEITGGAAVTGISALILLRAFASGAVALTGVEAIADGVPAFQKPESRNAARTLTTMAVILGTAFFGLGLLTNRLNPTASEHETLLSILGTEVFGSGTVLYYVLQFSTFAILILAANTAYADFPRLSSIIARDEFLPHQFKNRGDRLVFSNGIVVLAVMAAVLIVAFGGQTTALIPLYAVGVFTGFTLSQSGMVRYQRRVRAEGWQRAHGGQPGRGHRHRHRARGGRRLQVHRRRLAAGRRDPGHRRAVQGHRPALRRRPRGDHRDGRVAGPPPHPHRRRAGRQRQQGHAAGPHLCPVPRPGPSARRHRRHGRRGGQRAGRAVGQARHPRRAPHPALAVPQPDPAGAAVPRRAGRRGP